MLTLRASGALLTAADSIDSLMQIAAALGCGDLPAPLDADTRRSLGVHDDVLTAHIASGAGAVRALAIEAPDGAPLRDLVPRIATRLAARTPHVLWLVLITQRSSGDVAIAAWPGGRRPPRVAALVVNRARVVDSDAETVRALAAAASAANARDVITHGRWVEVLGREALTIRFYRALERCVGALAASTTAATLDARRELALLNVSRLLFLAFLEAKGWLDGDGAFLTNQFDRCAARGGRFHDRVLRPLFFGTLNTPVTRRAATARTFGAIPFLNGGLFARTALERRHRDVAFSDDAYGALLYDVFGHYRFTAREESANWTEAAVDPEMLGRAFESLMASRERRRTGAFYTPFSLVERVAASGLEALSLDTCESIRRVTVLDPACGSGAFLVYTLERLSEMLIAAGDTRSVSAVRRAVLTRSIFGVDINPTAVWLCELRLWLSVVIESGERDPAAVPPLPNLDRNIRVGDALAGAAFSDSSRARDSAPARSLRERYARATGVRKRSLARALDRVERSRAIESLDARLASLAAKRRDLLHARRGRDLFGDRYRPSRAESEAAVALRRAATVARAARRRLLAGGALPFSFAAHFSDVAGRAGFSLIIGNPPWVRLHRIPIAQRSAFRRDFVVARQAGWEAGAVAAGAGRGFAAQIDVAALFIERSVRLLAPDGALALLVPAKLWRSLAGGGVRRLLGAHVELRRIDDYSEAPAAFDAAVYPSLIVASRSVADQPSDVRVAVHHRGHEPFTWCSRAASLAFDNSPGAPWLLLPPEARRAFDWLGAHGQGLAQSVIGRPLLGVKCGLNDAFVVDVVRAGDELADVHASTGEIVTIERSMLRPLIRGDAVHAWRIPESGSAIIWTHDDQDEPLRTLPPHAARWFMRWRRSLMQRADARNHTRWWSLFRTESARCDVPRVVWGDVGRSPRASVLDAGDARVPLNTCYVARCPDAADAHALAALLNSPLARAWLNALAEPARGGYRRYLGWTLSLLPIPRDWSHARAALADASRCAHAGAPPSDARLFEIACAAYGATSDCVAPLVAWCAT